MSNYIYNDEDNAPMNDIEDPIIKYTTYMSRAEMKAYDSGEALPFEDGPDNGCWNCLSYDASREACTAGWNNLDESYYNPDTDNRDPSDHCDLWDRDENAVWEDFFGED